LAADTLTWDKNYDKAFRRRCLCQATVRMQFFRCVRAEYAPGDNIIEAIGETVLEIESKMTECPGKTGNKRGKSNAGCMEMEISESESSSWTLVVLL